MKYAKKLVQFVVVNYKNGENIEMAKDVIVVHDVELIQQLEEKRRWIANIFTGLHSGFWAINH
ncbi:hypothetical protein IJJ27_03665 [bacterium]|nr:hypothetical protein [bacterium]